ncbi:MgtC/SapB family protein [Candidatus Nomurabacteria bacterium]|nr:MgtC/SapB family protein [Candidatus Nomurabacteria bacterium]MCB9820687.1 MgtC/SapB family protein [Candidatus Nomurabacteria bacterium]
METLGMNTATFYEAIVSLGVATICGVIIGTERLFAHKTAGMRTYALVSMGAALFIIISNIIVDNFGASVTDPLRVASTVVTGVGFLGAGLIVLKESTITGVTTASSIWVSAGIGMAAGFGLHGLAIAATIITLIIFVGLWYIEEKLRRVIKDYNVED